MENEPEISVHHLMQGMGEYLRAARYKSRTGYLKPNKRNIPYIFVTPECVNKAIGFANTFFWALKKKRHYVELKDYRGIGYWAPKYDIYEDDSKMQRFNDVWSPGKSTYVDVNGIGFSIVIFEMLSEEDSTYIDGTYYRDQELTPALIRKMATHYTWGSKNDYPTGRLCLLIYSYDGWVHRWKEAKNKTLEKQIPNIIKTLRESVPALNETKERLRLEADERRRKWDEEERLRAIQKEKDLVAKATAKSMEGIEEIIAKWNKASSLHAFFTSIETSIQKCEEGQKSRLVERVKLAKELIGTIDPIEHLARWKSPSELAEELRANRSSFGW